MPRELVEGPQGRKSETEQLRRRRKPGKQGATRAEEEQHFKVRAAPANYCQQIKQIKSQKCSLGGKGGLPLAGVVHVHEEDGKTERGTLRWSSG